MSVPDLSQIHIQITPSGFAFAVFAAITLVSALMVVTLRNLFHCALFLGMSFIGVAGLYVLLNAEFLAAAQVLIYVGAITVLIMLAIMLTQRIMSARTRRVVIGGYLGFPVAAGIAAALIWGFSSADALSPLRLSQERADWADWTSSLSVSLLAPYLLPFELASVVLLVALVAAVVLAVEDRDPAHPEPLLQRGEGTETPSPLMGEGRGEGDQDAPQSEGGGNAPG